MKKKHLIFVYGTLKNDCYNNYLINRKGCRFICNVKTRAKYRLYDTGLYPLMIESKNRVGVCIEGEVWEVTERVLEILDCLERVPYFYIRKPIHILTMNHPELTGRIIYGYLFRNRMMARYFRECSPRWNSPLNPTDLGE